MQRGDDTPVELTFSKQTSICPMEGASNVKTSRNVPSKLSMAQPGTVVRCRKTCQDMAKHGNMWLLSILMTWYTRHATRRHTRTDSMMISTLEYLSLGGADDYVT